MGLAHFDYSFERISQRGRPGWVEETLERLFSAWSAVCDEFVEHVDVHPFACNERTSVASLCMAARDVKIFSVVDLATTKKKRDDLRKRAAGFVDILMYDGDDRQISIEAKQVFPKRANEKALLRHVKSSLHDVNRNKDDSHAYIGITIFCPMISASRKLNEDRIVCEFNEIYKYIATARPSYVAKLISKAPVETKSENLRGVDYFWPGAIVSISKGRE